MAGSTTYPRHGASSSPRSLIMWVVLLLGCCATCWVTLLVSQAARPAVVVASTDDIVGPDKTVHQPNDAPLVKCPLNKTFLAAPIIPTALMSFPGSGNKWTRHVIESLTGYHTGSIYCDKSLLPVFTQECAHNKWNVSIAVKTHRLWDCARWAKAVVVVRNPLRAILAEYQRTRAKSHTGFISPEEWSWEDWYKFAGNQCKSYKQGFESVFGSEDREGCTSQRPPGDYKALFYEDIKTPSGSLNPYFLDELLEYFAIKKFDSFYDCALSNNKGHYARNLPADHPAKLVLNDTATADLMREVGCSTMYNQVLNKFPRLKQAEV